MQNTKVLLIICPSVFTKNPAIQKRGLILCLGYSNSILLFVRLSP